LLEYSTTRLTS